ncbi:hypothetical protein CaCOL14_003781 [Colletotrichum acutatum]|uniref:Uncharacterized protein n=1 Tax=Glomerella acutata TaxID=27357 RepID=A0AAD8UKN2_GLOAC|nr:uncharacterized protein BDZ83DRAFT_775202 [Colletotrichum acutatum]KAK1726077.1 hypothetical protein BDZ83DRAFT_775202 [Colletotrichum acutatum]
MASIHQGKPLISAETLMHDCDAIISATLDFLEGEKQKGYKNIHVESLEEKLLAQKIFFGFCKTTYKERRAGSRNSNEDNILKKLNPVKTNFKKVQDELEALLQADKEGALEDAKEKTEVAFAELAGSVERLKAIFLSP